MWTYMQVIASMLKPLSNAIKKQNYDALFSLILYRDYPPQDMSYITYTRRFTKNINKLVKTINLQRSQGGGDGPEALEYALYESANILNWRDNAHKACIVLTDAVPHGVEDTGDKIKEPYKEINKFFKTDYSSTDELFLKINNSFALKKIQLTVLGIEPAIFEYPKAIDFYVNKLTKNIGSYKSISIDKFELIYQVDSVISELMNTEIHINITEVIDYYNQSNNFFEEATVVRKLKKEEKNLKQKIKENQDKEILGSRYRDFARIYITRYEMQNFYTSDNAMKFITEQIYTNYVYALETFYKHKSLFQVGNCARDIARLLERIPTNLYASDSLLKLLELLKKETNYQYSFSTTLLPFDNDLLSDFLFLSHYFYKESSNYFFSSILLAEYINHNLNENRLTNNDFIECINLIETYTKNKKNHYLNSWSTNFTIYLISLKSIFEKEINLIETNLNKIVSMYERIIQENLNQPEKIDSKIILAYIYILIYKNEQLIELSQCNIEQKRKQTFDLNIIYNQLNKIEKIILLAAYAIQLQDIHLKQSLYKILGNIHSNSKISSLIKKIEINSHKNFFSSESFMLSLLFQLLNRNENNVSIRDYLSEDIKFIENTTSENKLFHPMWFLYQTPASTNIQFEKKRVTIIEDLIIPVKVLIQVSPSILNNASYYLLFYTDNDIEIYKYPLNNLALFNHRVEEFRLDISKIPTSPRFEIYASIKIFLENNNDEIQLDLANDKLICEKPPAYSYLKKMIKLIKNHNPLN